MSLYTDLKDAGLVTGYHATDLYVLDTPEARTILAAHGKRPDGWSVQAFTDQVTGKRSLDVVFGYEPAWQAMSA